MTTPKKLTPKEIKTALAAKPEGERWLRSDVDGVPKDGEDDGALYLVRAWKHPTMGSCVERGSAITVNSIASEGACWWTRICLPDSLPSPVEAEQAGQESEERFTVSGNYPLAEPKEGSWWVKDKKEGKYIAVCRKENANLHWLGDPKRGADFLAELLNDLHRAKVKAEAELNGWAQTLREELGCTATSTLGDIFNEVAHLKHADHERDGLKEIFGALAEKLGCEPLGMQMMDAVDALQAILRQAKVYEAPPRTYDPEKEWVPVESGVKPGLGRRLLVVTDDGVWHRYKYTGAEWCSNEVWWRYDFAPPVQAEEGS